MWNTSIVLKLAFFSAFIFLCMPIAIADPLNIKNTANKEESNADNLLNIDDTEVSNNSAALKVILRYIDKQNESNDGQAEVLEAHLFSQDQAIRKLKSDFKILLEKPITNGSTFEVWSGIILASVTVIITVFGVVVAIISLMGFRNIRIESQIISERTAKDEASSVAQKEASKIAREIMTEAVSKSSESAEKIARKTANNITVNVAEKTLKDYIDNGLFDDVIKEAINKIAFSSIEGPENYEEAERMRFYSMAAATDGDSVFEIDNEVSKDVKQNKNGDEE